MNYFLSCSHFREYKFYLSFENSVCEDYVTEKFWKVLDYSVIPVVLGGANYSKFAPAKSYINIRDYATIGVNFINILCTRFSYERHVLTAFYSYMYVEKQYLHEKFVHIMLMKLTTGHV